MATADSYINSDAVLIANDIFLLNSVTVEELGWSYQELLQLL